MKEICRINDEIVWNPWDEEDAPEVKREHREKYGYFHITTDAEYYHKFGTGERLND